MPAFRWTKNKQKQVHYSFTPSITNIFFKNHFNQKVNVNQDISQVDNEEVRNNATSLSGVLGKSVCREMVLASFCNELEELLVLDLQGVLDSYREVDLLAGAKINVMPKKRENPERRRAEVIEISADGSLVVKYEDTGEVVNLLGEEVSVRLQ